MTRPDDDATDHCSACGAALIAGGRFCAACGRPASLESEATGTAPRSASPRPPATPSRRGDSHTSGLSTSAPIDDSRFAPGTVVADRYRIVGALGRGGMGEVYRAEDLTLGQPVALKFLPQTLARDSTRLARFYDEVRVARQVSHPAVCRVHDIGELDGVPFLSMEYVDGEDLASLLRRIGRLPPDKALDIARQLAAGLAAAHARSVLHRDLKPHNVMLDSRGAVRLTDFGLAGLAESFAGEEVRSGTPAYMSPEQLAGREVTAASDVYALGVVLYELFTGRRPFLGKSLAELTRQHLSEVPVPPGERVSDIDAAVERTILACLEKDPARRPASMLAVAAMLPGGDPLKAALAAGDTPSPAVVAAARGGEGTSPGLVAALVGLIATGTLAVPWLTGQVYFHRYQPLETPIGVLEYQAREMLGRLGYGGGADAASGLDADEDYLIWVQQNDLSPERWEGLSSGRPAVAQLWYRESPGRLVARNLPGRVTADDPVPAVAGMTGVWLDMQGRLLRFYALPPQVEEETEARAVDWSRLFEEAGLDPETFQPVPPRWTPPGFADERAAWEGPLAPRSDLRVRIEAAAYRGRPTQFRIVGDWTRPDRDPPSPATAGLARAQSLVGVVLVAALLGSAVLARRHLRLGRGDRPGALRASLYCLCSLSLVVLLSASHVAHVLAEMTILVRGLGFALLFSAWIWLTYLAVEPYLRRWMPEQLVSWARLLRGRFGDARVGRDLLVGIAAGVFIANAFPMLMLLPRWRGLPPPLPWPNLPLAVEGPVLFVADVIDHQIGALGMSLFALLAFLLLRLALRRAALAAVALVILLALPNVFALDLPLAVSLPLGVLVYAPLVLALLRLGLVSVTAAYFVSGLLLEQPLVVDPGSWLFGTTLATWAVVAALTGFAARSALGTPVAGAARALEAPARS